MRRLRAIGQSPLTPLIGAALAAVGAAVLIGFALVAQVSLPDRADPDRVVVRSNAGETPEAIDLPTPSPLAPVGGTGSIGLPGAPGGLIPEGAVVSAPTIATTTTTGLDVTSPPVAPAPIDDGFGFRPSTRGLLPPSLRGRDGEDPSSVEDKGAREGKARGHQKKSRDGGGSARHADGERHGWAKSSGGSAGPSSDGSHGYRTGGSGSGGAKHDAHKAKGHGKSKGKGHSKHRHGGRH